MTSADPTALGLDPDLLEILACPAPDHGPLEVADAADAAATDATAGPGLRCTSCGRRYPVTDGIPVLLLSEATGGPGAPGEPAGADRGV